MGDELDAYGELLIGDCKVWKSRYGERWVVWFPTPGLTSFETLDEAKDFAVRFPQSYDEIPLVGDPS